MDSRFRGNDGLFDLFSGSLAFLRVLRVLRVLRAFDGQEPECLEGHGWPREAVADRLISATLEDAHLPLKAGLRRSRNALVPSRMSAVEKHSANVCVS
jgi:hypothetical protein